MGLDPDARLSVNRDVDLRTLEVTPGEFFVYSRVEGSAKPPTVSEVMAASGLPADMAASALEKLLKFRAVLLVGGSADTPSSRPRLQTGPKLRTSHDLRERARNRKRGLLEAQMRVLKRGDARGEAGGGGGREGEAGGGEVAGGETASTKEGDEPSLPTPRAGQKPATRPDGPRSILELVEPVPEDDPRLDPTCAIPLDRQRRLLAVRERLRVIGHFEILGLEPVDDTKAIRRAYHGISREFHPDSFYGKDIGIFRAVLSDLFRRTRASYDFLLDPSRRKTLIESHEARVREERAQSEAASAQPKPQPADSAGEARLEDRARAALAERERARHERTRELARQERRERAAAHAKQARDERSVGRHGTAATLFRLAHEHDPDNPEYERAWRESLALARGQRAEASFGLGQEAVRSGRIHEAARHFSDAAEADPSLRNLSEAAAVVAEINPAQARSYAISALEMLQQALAKGVELDRRVISRVHQACATAFLAVGQLASAREQAERAHELSPSKRTRTLLNSIKVT